MKEEELTYEILVKRFREQDRLIAEGKMERPQIVYDVFTEEDWAVVNEGWTLERVLKSIEEKYGKI